MPRLALPSLERIPGGRGFAALSRRVRALIVGGVLFVVLFVLVLSLPVPYAVLSPGPTCNVLGTDAGAHCVGGSGNSIIVIKGRTANRVDGNLNLTTVSESTDSVTAFQAFVGWLKHDEVVVPKTALVPPGSSQQQQNAQNAQDFTQSQDSATAAAGCELGYPSKHVEVLNLTSHTAAAALQAGDVLDAVDGTAVTSSATLRAALATREQGAAVKLAITRNGKTQTETVTLGAPVAGRQGGSLGITAADQCPLPFSVDLGLGNSIGGPSAGMMFALGIIAKVGKADITHGRFIAGTGTIDDAGQVGPIGGIALKMIAARDAGASIFLAPSGNCADVRGNVPAGLTVAKVSTLHEAVTDLARLQNGQSVPGC